MSDNFHFINLVGVYGNHSPPREGPALLQGLIVCGICGGRMTVRYHTRGLHRCPHYVCQRQGIEHGESICQTVPGAGIDQAVGELLVAAVTPVALVVALCVQQELQSRLEEADRRPRADAPAWTPERLFAIFPFSAAEAAHTIARCPCAPPLRNRFATKAG